VVAIITTAKYGPHNQLQRSLCRWMVALAVVGDKNALVPNANGPTASSYRNALNENSGANGSGLKWIVKPDSVMTHIWSHSDHSSCPVIAHGVERPYPRVTGGPPNPPIWSCSGWGLPSVHHHWRTGELLPRHFNLTSLRLAVYFLWYFPPITRGRH